METKQKATVCKSEKTGKYSIRTEGYLFWTGIKTDSWVEEDKDTKEIWELKDKDLVYVFCGLINYVLLNDKTVQGILDDAQ